jgi:hypothetical protein
MLLRVALVGTDVSEERISYIIRLTKIGALGTTLAGSVPISSIVVILMMGEILCSETSNLT